VWILAKAQENASGMLGSRAEYYLGILGDATYYVVDGILWKIADGGLIYQNDDDNEEAIKMVRKFRQIPRKCDHCGKTLTRQNCTAITCTCDDCCADRAAEHNNSYHAGEW
jgi:hypothetical protein